MKKESDFQKELIKDIRNRFPGSIVLKNDPTYIQGIPDLTVLYNQYWATLEVKRSSDEVKQPNQEYYIKKMNAMSYSKLIHPDNKEEVLAEMERSFKKNIR